MSEKISLDSSVFIYQLINIKTAPKQPQKRAKRSFLPTYRTQKTAPVRGGLHNLHKQILFS